MREHVRQIIQQHNLIPPKSRLVIGVSGGADSLCLLHLLRDLAPTAGWYLHVATLDHGLRGADSAADAQFVADLSAAWEIPCTVGHAGALESGSVEMAARRARYEFLAATAREVEADLIAVAHHADDQVETVLLRLLRGTGLRGLRGMTLSAPLPFHPEYRLIRPLLLITRAQIDSYCIEHHLQPRVDVTNSDTRYLRNAVRHQLLPLLDSLAPAIRQTLTRTAETAAIEDAYLSQEMNRLLTSDDCVNEVLASAVRRDVFRLWHPAIQRRWITGCVERLAGAEWVDHDHVIAAQQLALAGKQGTRALFAGGCYLRVDYEWLRIEHSEATLPVGLLQPGTDVELPVPGILQLPGIEVHVDPEPGGVAIATGVSVRLRTRRSGDRFAPPGLQGHTHKLSRWMVDHKIPHSVRAGLPLLEIDGQVAAVWWKDDWHWSSIHRNQGGSVPRFQVRLQVLEADSNSNL